MAAKSTDISTTDIYSLQTTSDINVKFNSAAINMVTERLRVAAAQSLLDRIVEVISLTGMVNVLNIIGDASPYTLIFQSLHGGSLADTTKITNALYQHLNISPTISPVSAGDYIQIISRASTNLSTLTITTSSIIEGAPAGTPVGIILGKSAGSILTLSNTAGNRFALSGSTLVTGAVPLDFETATSHMIVVEETLAGSPNSPCHTTLMINVINNPADDFVVVDQIATFGALTGPGAIGFRPVTASGQETALTGTPQLISGSLGGYTAGITNGRLTFAGAVGAPNNAVIRCDLLEGGSVLLTVNSVADAYTVGSTAEFINFLNLSSTAKSGKTCIVRIPDTDGYGLSNSHWNGKFLNLTNKVYIRGEKSNLRPKIGTGGVFTSPNAGGQPQGKVDFTGLHWYGATVMESKLTGNFSTSANDLFTVFFDADDVRVADCMFSSNVTPARLNGERPRDRFTCVLAEGTNIIVEDNTLTNFVVGITVGGANGSNIIVRRNTLSRFWDDPFRVVTKGAVSNVSIYDNIAFDCIGDHGYHPDMLHMFGTSSNQTISGVTIQGNIFWPGTEGALAPAWPVAKSGSAYTRETTLTVGERSLTTSDHQKFIFVDARTSASKINLPPLSTVGNTPNSPDYLIQSWLTPSSGMTISPAAGDILYDADLKQNVSGVTLSAAWETIVVWRQTSPDRWAFNRQSPSYQGIFTNDIAGTGAIGAVTAQFNLLWINANCVRDANDLGDPWHIFNNSFLPVYYNLGVGAAGYNPQGLTRFIQSDYKTASDAAGNISSSVSGFSTVSGSNVTSTELDLNNSWQAVMNAFSVENTNVQKWAPGNIEEAISLARPRAGGSLPTGIGCGLSVDKTNDYYNFGQFPAEPRGVRRNTPWEVVRLTVSPIGGGYLASWQAPAYSASAVTGYECQFRVNGGSWTNASVIGMTSSRDTLAIGDIVSVRIRASNNNGAGTWASVAPVVVSEPASGPSPTLTTLLSSTVATQSAQIQSSSFAVSGQEPLVIGLAVRSSITTSVMVPTATIGSSGRPFGTGTPLTLVASQSSTRNAHTFLFTIGATVAASGQTIQVSFTDTNGASYNANGAAFYVYEVVGGKDNDLIGATNTNSSNTSATISTNLTTISTNATLLGIMSLTNTPTVSVTGYDAILSQDLPNGATRTVSAIRQVSSVGNYSQAFNWSGSHQSSALVVEIKAAPRP